MYNYMYACSTRGIDAKVVSEECLHHKILLNIDLTKFLIIISLFLYGCLLSVGERGSPFLLF